MDRFNALSRGMQIMFVAGVLLLIDTFLPWQDFDLGGIVDDNPFLEGLGVDVDTTVSAWHGLFGVVLGLLVVLLVAWVVVHLAAVDIPLPISSAMTAAVLGTLIPFFAVAKTLFQDGSTIWSYIGAVLAVVVGVGAWRTVQEAGGVETLKSEVPGMPNTFQAESAPPGAATSRPEGWYDDAERPGRTRWWDGTAWGIADDEHPAPAGEPRSEATPAASSSAPEPSSAAPQARFCKNCGAERSPGGNFCASCGSA